MPAVSKKQQQAMAIAEHEPGTILPQRRAPSCRSRAGDSAERRKGLAMTGDTCRA
jgi:hypothetical protein